MPNEYVKQIKEEQRQQKNVTNTEHTLKDIQHFIEKTATISALLPNEEQEQLKHITISLQKTYDEMLEEYHAEYKKWRTLFQELNAGNLRHVVHSLIEGERLTREEFAKKIGYTEKDITNLLKNGVVTMTLLHSICEFFHIEVTEPFERYVHV